jgi:hypothetical protein
MGFLKIHPHLYPPPSRKRKKLGCSVDFFIDRIELLNIIECF